MNESITYALTDGAASVAVNTLSTNELHEQIRYFERRLTELERGATSVPQRSLARTYRCLLRQRRSLLTHCESPRAAASCELCAI